MAVNMNKLVRALEVCAEEASQDYVDYIFTHDDDVDLRTVFESPTAMALKVKAEVFSDLLDALKEMA